MASAHAPTARDAATQPADAHSPPPVLPISHPNLHNRETLLIRTRQGSARIVRVKEANAIVALPDAVGEVPRQHTTTTYCQDTECRDRRKERTAHTTTFVALARNQSMTMTPPTHDLIECKRHASVRRGIDFKFCVEGGRFIIVASARTLVS